MIRHRPYDPESEGFRRLWRVAQTTRCLGGEAVRSVSLGQARQTRGARRTGLEGVQLEDPIFSTSPFSLIRRILLDTGMWPVSNTRPENPARARTTKSNRS